MSFFPPNHEEGPMPTTEQGTGWKVAVIDDIPPVKEDWPATWKSVRHHFGITAFGINAVTKDEGNVLIPEHDETASGQQEVYFVHAGEALATLEGQQVHVAAGTAVACEPEAKRKFEAAASPTTLIVIGGTPGRAYEVGPWEK
jgi:mannose-6-phosphate isomerase-like protein (cupin superfamily)